MCNSGNLSPNGFTELRSPLEPHSSRIGEGPNVQRFDKTFGTGRNRSLNRGSHQIILGGAVKGRDIYGHVPALVVNGPDDTDDGRWIPTTSVDEYSATLARWFGVSGTDLNTVFPNLNRFATPDMGFMMPG